MESFKKIVTFFVFFTTPFSFVFAQDTAWLASLATSISDVVPNIVIFLSSLALIYFILGMVQFVGQTSNDQARAEGKVKMVWGIFLLFVLFSTWGLVVLFQEVVGVDGGSAPSAPQTSYSS